MEIPCNTPRPQRVRTAGAYGGHRQGFTSVEKSFTMERCGGAVICIVPSGSCYHTHKTFCNNLILPNFNIWSNRSEESKTDSDLPNEITHLLRGFQWHFWNVSRWLISKGEGGRKVGLDVSEI